MRVPLCDLGPGLARDRELLRRAIDEVIEGGQFVLGPAVERFEGALAGYLGGGEVVGVASGSDALELSLRALDIGCGKAVLTSPFSFVATAEAIANAGAAPVFSDIREADWLLDIEGLGRALDRLPSGPDGQRRAPGGQSIAAVMPVHLFGAVHDPAELEALARRHRLIVIEDVAQALGGSSAGRKAGTLGEIGCFSFFPAKTLGALGDGGAVWARTGRVAERLRSLRQHGVAGAGRDPRERGRNSRLDALQAAVLSVKLPGLDRAIDERRALRRRYHEALGPAAGWLRPLGGEDEGHAAQQMIVRTERRPELAARLAARGVATAVYYPRTIPSLVPYRGADVLGALPVAERAASTSLALPLYPGLPVAWVDEIGEAIVSLARPG